VIASSNGGSTWSSWTKIPYSSNTLTFESGPALVTTPNGQLTAFSTWEESYNVGVVLGETSTDNGATWSQEVVLPPNVGFEPPAATSAANGNIQVIGRGTDAAYYLNPYRGP
ncbi:MAG TPA: sialidase family protein, partial [Polyangia bacterium]|nr:sialidase family protein [Polyangia bacterium]